jgi:hypothetical protein
MGEVRYIGREKYAKSRKVAPGSLCVALRALRDLNSKLNSTKVYYII